MAGVIDIRQASVTSLGGGPGFDEWNRVVHIFLYSLHMNRTVDLKLVFNFGSEEWNASSPEEPPGTSVCPFIISHEPNHLRIKKGESRRT